MNWLQKKRFLRKQERIRKQLRASHATGIARWCFTCGWFIMRMEKPHNRMCRCPADQLHFRGNECLGWKLDSNVETRKASVTA